MNDDPITVVSSQEMRMLMTALSARDGIKSRQEVILSDDAQGFLTLEKWLSAVGVTGYIADSLLAVKSGGALSRAVANDDLFLRLQMVKGPEEEGEYYAVKSADKTDDTDGETDP